MVIQLIIETVSKNKESLHFKNMWGGSTDKYDEVYKNSAAVSDAGTKSG